MYLLYNKSGELSTDIEKGLQIPPCIAIVHLL